MNEETSEILNKFNKIAEKTKRLIEKHDNNLLCYEPMPAKVVKYDYKKRTVDILPLVQILDECSDEIENCELNDVPVMFVSSEKIQNSFPIKGTEGLFIPTKVGIENWQIAGGTQKEALTTRFSRRNGFFIPGVFSKNIENKYIDNEEDFIKNFFGNAEFRVKNDGSAILTFTKSDIDLGDGNLTTKSNGNISISFKKADIKFNSVDILQKCVDLCEKIEKLTTKMSAVCNSLASAQYGGTPGPTTCASDLISAKAELDTIKSDVSTIKSDFTNAKA